VGGTRHPQHTQTGSNSSTTAADNNKQALGKQTLGKQTLGKKENVLGG